MRRQLAANAPFEPSRLGAFGRGGPTPRARVPDSAPPIASEWLPGTRTRHPPPRSATALRLRSWRPCDLPPVDASKARTAVGQQKGRLSPALLKVLQMQLLLVPGRVGDRVERVHLPVAVPRVVSRPALAGLWRTALGADDGRVARWQGLGTRLRIGRLA